jgi:hypothetical protein
MTSINTYGDNGMVRINFNTDEKTRDKLDLICLLTDRNRTQMLNFLIKSKYKELKGE